MENNYNIIFKEGEKFWDMHNRITINELRDIINLVEVYHNLPNCYWDDIKHWHCTNYSTLWQFTSRWFDFKYPNTIGNDKPPLSMLKWLYDGLKEKTN